MIIERAGDRAKADKILANRVYPQQSPARSGAGAQGLHWRWNGCHQLYNEP